MIVRILQAFIRFYSRFISRLLGQNCRFYPTCSCYVHEALEKHGALKGLYLGVWRILRCQPWGGKNWVDPVPDRFAWRDFFRYKRAGRNDISQKNES
jgi:putative membrane protein insertion efficiency factor